MRPISVFLVDDHTVVRQAVRLMLEAESDIEVCGEADGADGAIENISALKPDVALVDLKMEGRSGLSLAKAVTSRCPRTAVIVFTMYSNPSYVDAAIRAGASGYVLKSATKAELLRAIRAVSQGSRFLQPEITKPLLRRLTLEVDSAGARSIRFTPRELEVLELLTNGASNKEVARILTVSEETIKTHLKHLYEKLGASDRAQAVAIALRQNLID
jgi:DNA-binding NarL/FixJ family response regulator